MADTFNWGVIGPGRIAHKFADAVSICPDARIFAVASRSIERADRYGDAWEIDCRYDNYQELVADPRVDAVYVSTTHPQHFECIKLCRESGKPVVCEKPLTMNAWQTEQVINLAREKKVFLMEAMWTRFLPVFRQVERWLAEGRIGEVQMVHAAFGFDNPWFDEDRHVDLRNGGGALLDLGVYNVALACRILGGEPAEIASQAAMFRTGADAKSSVLLRYTGGAMAVLTNALTVELQGDAVISGSKGSIRLPQHWRAIKAELILPQPPPKAPMTTVFEAGFNGGNGYQFEVQEAMARIRAGELESPLMPWADSLAISRIMTAVRRQWGMVYPDTPGEE